jgi:hypothetical protein
MMKYLSVTQTAEEWGISKRRIQTLCNEGRVEGAVRIGYSWAIPNNVSKPSDARIKSGKYIKQVVAAR